MAAPAFKVLPLSLHFRRARRRRVAAQENESYELQPPEPADQGISTSFGGEGTVQFGFTEPTHWTLAEDRGEERQRRRSRLQH